MQLYFKLVFSPCFLLLENIVSPSTLLPRELSEDLQEKVSSLKMGEYPYN